MNKAVNSVLIVAAMLLASVVSAAANAATAGAAAPAATAAAAAATEAAPAATEAAPAAKEAAAAVKEEAEAVNWKAWKANNQVDSLNSLQRGARNFMSYCVTCHSLKYMRYSRMATDLQIPTEQLQKHLMPIAASPNDYITTSLRAEDGVTWFGKEPPDLSLMARERGVDYLYRFLKTFYTDPARPTLTNNLALENAAMPAVLSDLGGVQNAVYRNVDKVVAGKTVTEKEFMHFELSTPGRLKPAEFDGFVRDTVNFLDYVGDPTQATRHNMGVWVVLFLLVFTWIAWLLKKEYWKDVH
jgi:ubiquinol-cytochrome c reductase cytochrome c1 subunit